MADFTIEYNPSLTKRPLQFNEKKRKRNNRAYKKNENPFLFS